MCYVHMNISTTGLWQQRSEGDIEKEYILFSWLVFYAGFEHPS